MAYILLVVGFILLIKGADFFVDGSSSIAKVLGVPSLIIGLTIVAFGTSAPEASVSISAALHNSNEIAIGNVVGSNICNLLLVLGVSSIFGEITTSKKVVFKDYLYSVLASLVLCALVIVPFMNKAKSVNIGFKGGLVLLILLVIYLIMLLKEGLSKEKLTKNKEKFKIKYILFFVVGLIGVIFGGNVVVENATKIAQDLGLSEHFIGLTVIAIGTSLPELVTSVVAAKKGEDDIAIGNVIGSNIFNILFILGTSAAISPLTMSLSVFKALIFLIIINILIFFVLKSKYSLVRREGIVMFILYILYTVYLIYN